MRTQALVLNRLRARSLTTRGTTRHARRSETGDERPSPHARHHTDRGFATVWAALAIAALLTLATAVVDLGSAVLTRHRAEAAADLAALAAAARAAGGVDAACTTAREVASAMEARLSECRLDDWNALVEVIAHRGWSLLAGTEAAARAHAGPVQASAGPDRHESGTDRAPLDGLQELGQGAREGPARAVQARRPNKMRCA